MANETDEEKKVEPVERNEGSPETDSRESGQERLSQESLSNNRDILNTINQDRSKPSTNADVRAMIDGFQLCSAGGGDKPEAKNAGPGAEKPAEKNAAPAEKTADKAQDWNNKIGREFFNGGANKNEFNGNSEGLRDALNQARKDMSPEEFKSFVNKIEKGTGGAFSHTESKDGSVDEVRLGQDRFTKDGSLITRDGDHEIRATADGKYFVKGPDGQEREYTAAKVSDTIPIDQKETEPGRFQNDTKRPILVVGNILDADGNKNGSALYLLNPGQHTGLNRDADALITDSRYQPRMLGDKALVPTEVPPDAKAYKLTGNCSARVNTDKNGNLDVAWPRYTRESGITPFTLSPSTIGKGLKTDAGYLFKSGNVNAGIFTGDKAIKPAYAR